VITVALADDPAVSTVGRVREVSPQADPVTRTFKVRVGLENPPEAMRLGATVTGRLQLESSVVTVIPASALTMAGRSPAVWVIDPASSTAALRAIDVLRFDPATVIVSQGLDPGDLIVTGGTQALHPGQRVKVLGQGEAGGQALLRQDQTDHSSSFRDVRLRFHQQPG
jgi:membrane fusion protein, multidrug efflux system